MASKFKHSTARTPFYLKSSASSCEPQHEWYIGCNYSEETERGFEVTVKIAFLPRCSAPKLERAGSSVTVVVSTEAAHRSMEKPPGQSKLIMM